VSRGLRIWALRILLGAAGLGVVLAGLFGLVWGCGYAVNRATDPHFKTRNFNSRIWIASRGDYDSPRGRMLDDLIHNRLKRGMKESEVIRLLGNPEEDNTVPPGEDPSLPYERAYGYFAGPYYRCVHQVLHVGYNRRARLVTLFQQYPKDTCQD